MEIKSVKNGNRQYPKISEINQKDVEKCILNKWSRIPGVTLIFNHFINSYVYANAISNNVSLGVSGGRFFTDRFGDIFTYHSNDSYFWLNLWNLCYN